MSYRALYREYRPQVFSKVVGQDPIVKTLKNQIKTGRVSHAYLFCGTRGTGKTTCARIFSRAINCLSPIDGEPCGKCQNCVDILEGRSMDVIEMDAASNRSVSDMDEVIKTIEYPPVACRKKVYIIDEVHMLSTYAHNAVLKSLEEPTDYTVFILATTDPQKLPQTVLSRCQRYDFKRISVNTIKDNIIGILKGDDRHEPIPYDEDAVFEIAKAGEGSMRDALSLADMCLGYEGAITKEAVRVNLATGGREFMLSLSKSLIAHNTQEALRLVDNASVNGRDMTALCSELSGHIRDILVAGVMGDEAASILEISEEDANKLREAAASCDTKTLNYMLSVSIEAEGDMKYSLRPRSILELACVRMCEPENEESTEALYSRISKLEKALETAFEQGFKPQSAPQRANAGTVKPAETKKEPAKAIIVPVDTELEAIFMKAVDILKNEGNNIAKLIGTAVKFSAYSYNNDVFTCTISKTSVSMKTLMEKKSDDIKRALSQIIGKEVNVHFDTEGINKPVDAASSTRSAMDKAFDVFGRENVELVD